MENIQTKRNLHPLKALEKKFASENYHLIERFFKITKQDMESYFDVVVFDFLLSVQIYLSNTELQRKYSFENISFMYMKRGMYRHFRSQKAIKRCSQIGTDLSYEEIGDSTRKSVSMENISMLECVDTLKRIHECLTEEQRKILILKLEGFSLAEIAAEIGIKRKRVYTQYEKIKRVSSYIVGN